MKKPANFDAEVRAALDGWHSNSEAGGSLLADLQLVQQKVGDQCTPRRMREVVNELLQSAVDQLREINAEQADILRLRFRDNHTLRGTAVALDISPDRVSRQQAQAIEALGTIIWQREVALRSRRADELLSTLDPPSYDRLFGFDEQHQLLVGELTDPGGAGVLAISGMGGIGKTSLADSVVREATQHVLFDDVVWLRVDPATISGRSATPQLLADIITTDLLKRLLPNLKEPLLRDERRRRLHKLFRQRRFLIVIDNIETNADSTLLVQQLREWAHPSRFILTTRTHLGGFSGVRVCPLSELAVADAARLVRHEARAANLTRFAADVGTLIDDIYDVTGGNPLALKLVVRLVALISLPRVLDNLRKGGRAGDVEMMYRRIYRQAWKTLNADARELLITMPMFDERGGNLEQLIDYSELDEDRVLAAISDLSSRSLLEVRGDYTGRRYGIHRLTMTFLRSDIIGGDWDFE